MIDLPAAVSAESQQLIEDAHRILQELHSFGVMRRRESRTTTAEDPSLGMINDAGGGVGSNFKDYIDGEKPFYTDDDGVTRHLQISYNEGEVRRAFSQSTTLGLGPPRVLLHTIADEDTDYPGEAEWKLYPIPDGLANTSTGEYTVQIPYFRYLDAPSTSDWFTVNAELFLLDAATAEAFKLNQDEAKFLLYHVSAFGPLWDQRGIMGGHLLRAVMNDKRQMTSITDTLVPYGDNNAPKLRL